MESEQFDIRSGMDVFDADGQKIGLVTKIAGFGATRVPGTSQDGSDITVIQARTGGGNFYVNREGLSGPDAGPLCIPFRGIREVDSIRGVTLTDTILHELDHQYDVRPVESPIEPFQRRKWLPKWLW